MIANSTDVLGERLTLRSQLSELAQVTPWIESLAARHSIPADKLFAMQLCLEEALSNIIRHGYSGDANRPIAVQFLTPSTSSVVLVVEDEAPPFNPLEEPEHPALGPLDENQIGGQGIRLLRSFADRLEYRVTPTGNQLRIAFSAELGK